MKQVLNQIANVALAGTLTFGASTELSVSQNIGPCLTRVEAQNATNSGRFLSFNAIKRMNGIGANATVLDRNVCRVDGQPYYIFTVVGPAGGTRKYLLRATDGTPYIAG